MYNKKLSGLTLSMALLLLTGCGKTVVTPEGESTKTGATAGTGTDIVAERTCTISEYDLCLSKFKMAKSDLNTCLQTAQKYQERLEAYQKRESENTEKTQRMNDIFKNYTETTEQKEFKFDLCGKTGTFASKPWFAEFQTTLENNPIAFAKAGRNLTTDDFTGGCASTEGNMAFFMGAETDGLTDGTSSGSDLFEPDDLFEFHLLKYDITNKKIEEVLMADNLCSDDTCPAIFHSREGAVIPMSGVSQNETCEYQYFFDQNMLVKTGCEAK